MYRVITLGLSGLLTAGLALAGQGPPDDGPPPPPEKAEKKAPPPPGGELRKTYDMLRHLRGGSRSDRLNDWVERSTDLYRKAVKAEKDGERHEARELAIAAHDLARAVDHARNAEQIDRPGDSDLPPPPEPDRGPEAPANRARRDLRHAYDRIKDMDDRRDAPDAQFYRDAARDLYNAARRDLKENRADRGGELARAAEALTHVPEHLARARDGGPGDEPPPPPDRKKGDRKKNDRKKEDRKKDEARKRPGPPPKEKEKEDDGPDDRGELPPEIPA